VTRRRRLAQVGERGLHRLVGREENRDLAAFQVRPELCGRLTQEFAWAPEAIAKCAADSSPRCAACSMAASEVLVPLSHHREPSGPAGRRVAVVHDQHILGGVLRP
jgi:hypothetical protein